MDELIFSGELLSSNGDSPFFVATVSDISSLGISISMASGMPALKKQYKHLENGSSYMKGDRVLCAKVSGTYVILGKIVT